MIQAEWSDNEAHNNEN